MVKKLFSKTILMKQISASAKASLLDSSNTNALTAAELRDWAPFNDFLIQNTDAVDVRGRFDDSATAARVVPAGNNEGWSVNQQSELNKYNFYDLVIENLSASTATTAGDVIVTVSKVVDEAQSAWAR